MCGPEAALAAQTAGTINQTIGSYYTARGQQISLNSQARMDEINARGSDYTARSAVFQGQREEQKQLLYGGRLKSSQRTGYAANGIALDSESAVNVTSSTDVLNQIDANTIRANAARTAWGYRTEATNYRNSALQNRAAAKAINPFMQAAGTLLTSAGDVQRSHYLMGKYSDSETRSSTILSRPKNFTVMPWQQGSLPWL